MDQQDAGTRTGLGWTSCCRQGTGQRPGRRLSLRRCRSSVPKEGVWSACARAERGGCHDGTVTDIPPQDADEAVAEVLAAVGQANGNAAAMVRAVRNWARPPNYWITGGVGRTYPSFTVRASTGRTAGTSPRGVLTLYADSHGSGPALEVRVIEMCRTPPYDRQLARERLTADLHAWRYRALTVRMSCTASGQKSRWPSSPTAASSDSPRSSTAGSAKSKPTSANLT